MKMTAGAMLKVASLLFTYFVLAPLIAAMIAYAAWKGKPQSFDREMYWTVFAAAISAAFVVVFYVQRHADTTPDVALFTGMILGGLLFGVSGGFGIGVFVRPKSTLPPFDSRRQGGNTDER